MSDLERENDVSDYNRVLEHYVGKPGDDADLVGLVAYALYKRQKRDWIIHFREENAGAKPSKQEVDAITRNYLTEDMRTTPRDRSEDILSRYAETYVDAITPQLREEAVNSEALRQAREIEARVKASTRFWPTVWSGIVATALWTFLVTALIAAAYTFGSDAIEAFLTARSVSL